MSAFLLFSSLLFSLALKRKDEGGIERKDTFISYDLI